MAKAYTSLEPSYLNQATMSQLSRLVGDAFDPKRKANKTVSEWQLGSTDANAKAALKRHVTRQQAL